MLAQLIAMICIEYHDSVLIVLQRLKLRQHLADIPVNVRDSRVVAPAPELSDLRRDGGRGIEVIVL